MTEPLRNDSGAAGGEETAHSQGVGVEPATSRLGRSGPGSGWVGIVANRGSGTGAGVPLVGRLVCELERFGFATEIAWTPSERQSLVVEAGRDGSRCRCLVAVGGDGTVAALINEQPTVPITILPAGTENLAAQHFGLKRNPARLAAAIAEGRVARVDLGAARGRRFMLMCGFGFDADVVTRHHRSRTSLAGKVKPTNRAAYVEPILRSSLLYRFPSITVNITDPGEEEVLTGSTVFVFNLPRYALGLPFAPRARQDDGFLDLVVFRDPGPFRALYYLWKVFWGTHLGHPSVFHRRIRRVEVTADEYVPVQLDGDPGGHLGPGEDGSDDARVWTVEVFAGAVDVLVPTPTPRRGLTVPLARNGVSR